MHMQENGSKYLLEGNNSVPSLAELMPSVPFPRVRIFESIDHCVHLLVLTEFSPTLSQQRNHPSSRIALVVVLILPLQRKRGRNHVPDPFSSPKLPKEIEGSQQTPRGGRILSASHLFLPSLFCSIKLSSLSHRSIPNFHLFLLYPS